MIKVTEDLVEEMANDARIQGKSPAYLIMGKDTLEEFSKTFYPSDRSQIFPDSNNYVSDDKDFTLVSFITSAGELQMITVDDENILAIGYKPGEEK